MPNDLYQWDRGLVHHCPFCFNPLNKPETRSRCLGEHVEWCKQYHNQLFKKGTSSNCAPCRQGDEERTKRHREIAEKIHELKQLKHENSPKSPLSPRSINAISAAVGSPMTKKERKAAKKAKKISEMVKVVSSADVDSVSAVLHSTEQEANDVDFERELVEDPDIHLNRFFHKGTSNAREVRNQFVKKPSHDAKSQTHVDSEELDGILQLLNVSPLTSKSSTPEKTIMAELRKKIEDNMIQEHHEKELMMMRKAGFWRWASKKAYKRLIQNGRVWSEKDSDSQGTKSDGMNAASSSSGAAASAEIEYTEPDSEASRSSEHGITKSMSTFNLNSESTTDHTPQKLNETNDGWTTVGKPAKLKTPTGNFKLAHNKGLAKIAQSSSSSNRGFYSSMLGRENKI